MLPTHTATAAATRAAAAAAEPNGYRPTPDDPRMVRSYAALEAIATSTGQNDSGLFELNFHDERYLPFEFAGAVSRWRIELPPETNFFDFDSLSDVVLHVSYTAREGGEVLRGRRVGGRTPATARRRVRLVDARRELPDAWTGVNPRERSWSGWDRTLDLRLSETMFPFLPGRRARWVDRLQVLVEAQCATAGANIVVRFVPGHHHRRDEPCDCERIDVHCVASREYPSLYWGVVDLTNRRLGPLGSDRPADLGTFEFPDDLGELCEMRIVAGYCAEPWSGRGDGSPCPCDRRRPCDCCRGGSSHERSPRQSRPGPR